MINTHLNNYYVALDKRSASPVPAPTQDELFERFPTLSRREAEIGQLLCGRLTSPQIASTLCISVRTVEVHIAHL